MQDRKMIKNTDSVADKTISAIIRDIRTHVDHHVRVDRASWQTRYTNACLTAREEFYEEHLSNNYSGIPWYRFYRDDGTNATRNGTRWQAINDVLAPYIVGQVVNHTSIWRLWYDFVNKARYDFYDAARQSDDQLDDVVIRDLFDGFLLTDPFEAPFYEYARNYAREQVASVLADDSEYRIVSVAKGKPIRQEELDRVLVKAQLKPTKPMGETNAQ